MGWSEGHFIDQPDLDSVADGEPPVDGGVVGAGGPVEESPVHGGAGGSAVDLDHVVLPLDALWAPGSGVLVACRRGQCRPSFVVVRGDKEQPSLRSNLPPAVS